MENSALYCQGVQCTVYTVQCNVLYTVQCTVYSTLQKFNLVFLRLCFL